MKKNKLLTLSGSICLVLILVVLASTSACAPPAPVKAIELSHFYIGPPTSVAAKNGLIPWERRVEEAAKGEVKITFYPVGTLSKVGEVYDDTIGGIVDIGWDLPMYYPGRFPLTDVMTLPYSGVPNAWVQGAIMWELYEKFPEIQAEYGDVKPLFFQGFNPHFIATSKVPVRKLEDLKGLKIGALGVAQVATLEALGAVPMFVPTPAAYEPLEKGVIDGVVVTWDTLDIFRLHEVVKYVTLPAPFHLTPAFQAMNLDVWNSLSPDIQEAIMSESGLDGSYEVSTVNKGMKEILLAIMEEKGYEFEEIIELSPREAARWEEIGGKPVWDKWVADMEAKGLPGRAVLDELFRVLKKYSK